MANETAAGRVAARPAAKVTNGNPSLTTYPNQVLLETVLGTNGRLVGEIVQRKDEVAFIKRRLDPARHQLRTPPAWAVELAHLNLLEQLGGPDAAVELHLTNGTVLRATVDQFRHRALLVRRQFGEQIALPLAHWQHGEEDRAA